MSLTARLLQMQTSASKNADDLINEGLDDIPLLLEWESLIKKSIQDIIEGKPAEKSELQSLLLKDKRNSPRRQRLSNILAGTKKQHLHSNKSKEAASKTSLISTSFKNKTLELKQNIESIQECRESEIIDVPSTSANLENNSPQSNYSPEAQQENITEDQMATPCNISKPEEVSIKTAPRIKRASVKRKKSVTHSQPKALKKPKISPEMPIQNDLVEKVKSKKTKETPKTRSTRQNDNNVLREIQKKEEIAKENIIKAKTLRKQKIAENIKKEDEKAENAKKRRNKFAEDKCSQSKRHENTQNAPPIKRERVTRLTSKQSEDSSQKPHAVKKTSNTQKSNKVSSAKSKSSQKPKEIIEEQTPIPAPTKIPKSKAKNMQKEKLKSTLTKKKEKTALTEIVQNEMEQTKVTPETLNHTYVSNTAANVNETFITAPTKVVAEPCFKTPVKPAAKSIENKVLHDSQKSTASSNGHKLQSYQITPLRNSYTSYDITEVKSDDDSDEETSPNNKPYPSWASGVHLKNSLLQQLYNKQNVDNLFGSICDTPDLSMIMGVKKKTYSKRTSSAIWSPNTSFFSEDRKKSLAK